MNMSLQDALNNAGKWTAGPAAPETMTHSAYVTWREDTDEFFVTQLDYRFTAEELEAARKWSYKQWVDQAADAENAPAPSTFDLVSILIIPYGTKVEWL